MKTFKLIVKENAKGKLNFNLENKGFSMFEISGFAKYLEIEAELEIIKLSRQKPKVSE